jgi:hypothetical protein
VLAGRAAGREAKYRLAGSQPVTVMLTARQGAHGGAQDVEAGRATRFPLIAGMHFRVSYSQDMAQR